jgi:hypothetical protein
MDMDGFPFEVFTPPIGYRALKKGQYRHKPITTTRWWKDHTDEIALCAASAFEHNMLDQLA